MASDGVARGVLSQWLEKLPPSMLSLPLALLFLSLSLPAKARGEADPKAAAREHFAKGVAAFDDRRFGEAAEEFETAYRLSPAFVVLYNIGQVDVVLGRSVEAVDAFERYLKQGASSISATRRQEVQREITAQTARIGTVRVRTTPASAELRVDGTFAGKTPLDKPLRLNAGKHAIEAMLAGYTTALRELEVGGRAEFELDLALALLPAGPGGAALSPPSSEPQAKDATVRPPVVSAAAFAAPATTVDRSVEKTLEKTVIERTYVEAPGAVQAATVQRDSSTNGNAQRVVGYVLIAGGLATATVGGLTAYSGANQANDARTRLAQASTPAQFDATLPDYDAGKSKSQKGWAIAGVGAAVLLGGVVVLATVPQKATTVGLGSWLTADAGGLVLSGAW